MDRLARARTAGGPSRPRCVAPWPRSGRCTCTRAVLALVVATLVAVAPGGPGGSGAGVAALGSESVRVEDDLIFFYVSKPKSLRYVYRALMAKDFGGVLNARYESIELVPSVPADGCLPLENELLIEGNMALVMRGVCSFAEKAWHAQQAGALAVLIYDSDRTNDDRWVDMVQEGDGGYVVTIPSMFVLGREGFKIVDGLKGARARSATISIPVNETHISPHQYFPGVLW